MALLPWHKILLLAVTALGVAGCAAVATKEYKQESPEPLGESAANKRRWMALAPFIKQHFKTDMGVKEIAAELSYQEYLMKIGKQE